MIMKFEQCEDIIEASQDFVVLSFLFTKSLRRNNELRISGGSTRLPLQSFYVYGIGTHTYSFKLRIIVTTIGTMYCM
jgi:hypothetical protein